MGEPLLGRMVGLGSRVPSLSIGPERAILEISVKLFGVFRIDRFKEAVRQYPPGTRVRQVVEELCFPDHLLGIVLINGAHADIDDLLQDGDVLSLLPVLDGG